MEREHNMKNWYTSSFSFFQNSFTPAFHFQLKRNILRKTHIHIAHLLSIAWTLEVGLFGFYVIIQSHY